MLTSELTYMLVSCDNKPALSRNGSPCCVYKLEFFSRLVLFLFYLLFVNVYSQRARVHRSYREKRKRKRKEKR